jgi:hypothetical protein
VAFEDQLRHTLYKQIRPGFERWQRQRQREEAERQRAEAEEWAYKLLENWARAEVLPVLKQVNRCACAGDGLINFVRVEYVIHHPIHKLLHRLTRSWITQDSRYWMLRAFAHWVEPVRLLAVAARLDWFAWGSWPEIGDGEGGGWYGANGLAVIVFADQIILRSGKPIDGGPYRSLRPFQRISRSSINWLSELQTALLTCLSSNRCSWRDYHH